MLFYAFAIFKGGGRGGHLASNLSIRPVRTSCPVRTSRMKNGFRVISFKYIGLLDSYFIPRYIIKIIQVKFDNG